MLQRLKDVPRGIDAIRAVGKLSKEDYETVLEPLLDEARRTGRRVRILCELGTDYEGLTPGGAWEDVKVGLRHLRLLDGCAIVTDVGWIREATALASVFLPCPVRVFGNGERNDALTWLGSLPERAGVTQRLLPDAGVLVVEVKSALRASDFDALSLTADTWIDAHGKLRGIVIHAGEFPGWESLGSLLRHIRFVRDHHRKVERVALAVDGKLAALAPHVVEHFIHAQVKAFSHDELDAAIAWARGSEPQESSNAASVRS